MVYINSSISAINNEIQNTKNPIKKNVLFVLKKILIEQHNQKIKKLEKEQEILVNTIKNSDSKSNLIANTNSNSNLSKEEKLRAYIDMIEEDDIIKKKESIHKTRGKFEKKWENSNLFDPKYIKYQQDDYANNRCMERFNSEIEFRLNRKKKTVIEKPFS